MAETNTTEVKYNAGDYVYITKDNFTSDKRCQDKLVKLLPCQHGPTYVNIHRKSIDPHNHSNSDGGYNILSADVRPAIKEELLSAGLIKPDVIDTYDIY